MTDCTIENRKLTPLSAVTNAAIIDLYEDSGKYFHRANFQASRGLKKLYNESLPKQPHKVWLHVNKNTHTATLPPDFNGELFVGIVENGIKIPIRQNTNLADLKNITDIPCEDK